jgi:hypothetical protein
MTWRVRVGLIVVFGCTAALAMATLEFGSLHDPILENVLPCGLGIGIALVLLLFVLPDGREHEDVEEGEPVCTRCLAVVPRFEHYCRRCGTAVGRFTPYLPFEYIPYYCEFFGRLWKAAWIQPGVSVLRRAGYLAAIVWFAPWMLLGLPCVPWARRLAQRRRNGLCLGCGGDLSGNESGTCPECGEACEPEGDTP